MIQRAMRLLMLTSPPAQVPVLCTLCHQRTWVRQIVRVMSASFNGSNRGFKHDQLHSRQHEAPDTSATSAQASSSCCGCPQDLIIICGSKDHVMQVINQRAPKPQLSNFCRKCGGQMTMKQPPTESELRHVCGACGYIDYYNPKLVVGCIVEHEGKVLLCRRAIEPCKGLWTVPAGFLEMGESTAAGAARETWEEANAEVEIMAPYAQWDIPVIGQSYLLFRAKLVPPYAFSPGTESLETQLFEPEDIPFDKVAFSSVSTALRLYASDLKAGKFHIHHGVIEKAASAPPNDPAAFQLRYHFAIPTAVPSVKR